MFVSTASPIFIRSGNLFGHVVGGGGGASNYSVRTTVVCGAGLLYRPEKQKCSTMLLFCTFMSTSFLGTVQCPCPITVLGCLHFATIRF